MGKKEKACHVLLLPYPSQGHYNPLLQFGKRLSAHGLRVTLAATRFVLKTTKLESNLVNIEPISDGFDHGGFADAESIETYLTRLELAMSATLEELLLAQKAQNMPIRVLIYDAFFPWALDFGRKLGLVCAPFFTQAAAVNTIYCHAWQKRFKYPVHEAVEGLPGLPRLEPYDLPPFLDEKVPNPYPAYLSLVLNQFRNLEGADVILVNSFYELEQEEMDWFKSEWNALTIGATVPSKYLDNRLPEDSIYGFNLYDVENTELIISWLDSKPPNSVVYISFGSMVQVSHKYMKEIAEGLKNSGKYFIWVVRSSEKNKLPENFVEENADKGLVITWSPQLQVLAHQSVGCFVTHCGWNSTTEALCLAVPMVGVPQWTDQTTNAKYIEDVWKVGVRARVGFFVGEGSAAGDDHELLLKREELERCIREVMEGEKSEEIKMNAKKWSELAKNAVDIGGSSDKNIHSFVSKYCCI